ncbi:hypothetical protein [Pararhodobacter marinus]|uniref:hypothetical protein n=1 Tax=Pararhodobacter marinus TaxID=2184063 RepID=UPI00351445DD
MPDWIDPNRQTSLGRLRETQQRQAARQQRLVTGLNAAAAAKDKARRAQTSQSEPAPSSPAIGPNALKVSSLYSSRSIWKRLTGRVHCMLDPDGSLSFIDFPASKASWVSKAERRRRMSLSYLQYWQSVLKLGEQRADEKLISMARLRLQKHEQGLYLSPRIRKSFCDTLSGTIKATGKQGQLDLASRHRFVSVDRYEKEVRSFVAAFLVNDTRHWNNPLKWDRSALKGCDQAWAALKRRGLREYQAFYHFMSCPKP